MRLEYWDFLTEDTLARVFPNGFPGFALEHAAVIETSLGHLEKPRPCWHDVGGAESMRTRG